MDHVTVCICAYKRSELLKKAIDTLVSLDEDARFSFNIMVVDNDVAESARSVVERASIEVEYIVEPVQSFSRARNAAIDHARGRYIAFLDDDEYPETDWLSHLYSAITEHEAAAALGVVQPYYDAPPPKWLENPRVNPYWHLRPKTGTMLRVGNTGNSILDVSFLKEYDIRFNEEFGASGGEDAEFFSRVTGAGGLIVSCREAVVHEYVSPARARSGYILRRKTLEGATAAVRHQLMRMDTGSRARWIMKSLIGLAVFPLFAIMYSVISTAVSMRYAMSAAYFAGYVGEHIVPGRFRNRGSLGD